MFCFECTFGCSTCIDSTVCETCIVGFEENSALNTCECNTPNAIYDDGFTEFCVAFCPNGYHMN